MKKAFSYLIPLLLLISLCSLQFLIPDTLEALRYRYFDLLQKLKPRIYQEVPVKVLDLDDATLEKFGQWPWPRTQMADLIRGLQEKGAAVIAFDILFSEPDRTSPRNLAPLWPEEYRDQLPDISTLPDHDNQFSETIKNASVVTAWSLSGESTPYMPAMKAGFSFAGDDPRNSLPNFPGAVKSLNVLEDAASGNGVINFFAEYDAVVRHIPMIFQLRGQLFPSLVAEALRLYTKAGSYTVKATGSGGETSYGEHSGIVGLKIGDRFVRTDKEGRLWLYDTGYIPERMLAAWKVLEDHPDAAAVKDSIIFVGTSAAGLKDLRTTPLNPVAAGVELHAQLAEQILLEDYLYRPDWAGGAEMLLTILVGLILILSMPHFGAAWSALIGAASFTGMFFVSWHAFLEYRWLVDPLLPSAACFASYLSSSLIHFLRTDSEKRQIRNAFSRYLAPEIVEQLANRPDQLKLGGEMKPMTLVFADIQGFTSISEKFTPHELTTFINRFLTPMTDIILKGKGTIDKYMGDSIMAFWNAPLPDDKHALHACSTALEMQKFLKDCGGRILNKTPGPDGSYPAVRLGIGINTGECCVGNMGSDQRFDYSVLGDSVNLASRLQGLCRLYGIPIIIGESTYQEASSLTCLEIDLVKVKGKAQASRIYALLGGFEMKSFANFHTLKEKHDAMLRAYREQEWKAAAKLAKECASIRVPELELEKLYALYLARIEEFQHASPGPEWDGITIAASK